MEGHGKLARTYGPWFVVTAWLGAYFPQWVSSFKRTLRFFSSLFLSWPISSVKVEEASKLFWYENEVSMRLYIANGGNKSHTATDNWSMSNQSFSFLVACQPSVFVNLHYIHIVSQYYCQGCFSHQSGYGQHISCVVVTSLEHISFVAMFTSDRVCNGGLSHFWVSRRHPILYHYFNFYFIK